MLPSRTLIFAGAFALVSGGAVHAGGLGDDHGEGDDSIFFGVVKDTRGAVIVGAHVNLTFKSMSFVTTTDAIGGYRISTIIDPDQSTVSCSKDGYRQSGTTRRTPPSGPKAPIEIDCTLQRTP
jgi:hypothetical protein